MFSVFFHLLLVTRLLHYTKRPILLFAPHRLQTYQACCGLSQNKIGLPNIFSIGNFHLKMNHKKQVDLAKYLGRSTSLVSGWCSGQKMPRVNTINEICRWLNIEMTDLLEARTRKKYIYEIREVERIANVLLEKQYLYNLFAICEKLPPEKIKSILDILSINSEGH